MARKRKIKRRPFFILVLLLIVLVVIFMIINKNKDDNHDEKEEPIKTSYVNKITYDNSVSKHIPAKAQEKIITFMDLYYRSMKELKVYDVTPLFADSAYEEAEITKTAISLLIDIRLSQVNDMSLTDCEYNIEYFDVKEDNNKLTISYYEGNVLNFKFMNKLPAKSFEMKNVITLENINSEYKIVAYERVDDFYKMVNDRYEKSGATVSVVKEELASIKTELLTTVQTKLDAFKEDYTAYVSGEVDTALECDHVYDRTKAATYASKWASKRNSDWDSYDAFGGNCNNYASQAILAGGIPMDITGPIREQWKHYSGTVVEKQVREGRSYSWTGVNQFYDYASSNKGSGMCAKVDVNLYQAEPGDIIQVGYNGAWTHTVIVVDVIKSEGKVIDILINSNSIDRENYPISAYNYPNKRLIKIYGWND